MPVDTLEAHPPRPSRAADITSRLAVTAIPAGGLLARLAAVLSAHPVLSLSYTTTDEAAQARVEIQVPASHATRVRAKLLRMIDVIDVTDGAFAADDTATTTARCPTSGLVVGAEAHQLVWSVSTVEARATTPDTAPGRAVHNEGSPPVRQVTFDGSQADAALPSSPTTAPRGKSSVGEGLSS